MAQSIYSSVLEEAPVPENDFAHWYSGYHGNEKNAVCQVRIYHVKKQRIVILTQLPENEGLSVTNGVEKIATEVQQIYSLRSDTIWLEHYLDDCAYYELSDPRDQGEHFSIVSFELSNGNFSRPRWKRLSIEDALRLIGKEA